MYISKFDRTEITSEEPIIFDAYNVVIHATGKKEKIMGAIYFYQQRVSAINYLETCFKDGKELWEKHDKQIGNITSLNELSELVHRNQSLFFN